MAVLVSISYFPSSSNPMIKEEIVVFGPKEEMALGPKEDIQHVGK